MYTSSKFLISIRYLCIGFMIGSVFIYPNEKASVSMINVFLLLIYILMSQLRFFYFSKNYKGIICTILLETFLGILLYNLLGGIFFLYFINVILDTCILLSIKYTVILFLFLMSYMCIPFFEYSNPDRYISMITIFFIGILGTYIKDEVYRKIEAQKLYDKLRISEENLKKANEDLETYSNAIEEVTLLRERNRLSRELHDSIGHSLSAISFQLGAVEKLIESKPMKAVDMARNLREYSQKTLQELRLMVKDMKPKTLNISEGILAIEELIREFKKNTGIEVNLRISKEKYNLNSDQCSIMYRVVQEFMTNSVKHGQATEININLTFNSQYVYLNIKDNGRGCSNIQEGFGLKNLRERLKGIKGEVSFYSEESKGFEMVVSIPSDERS